MPGIIQSPEELVAALRVIFPGSCAQPLYDSDIAPPSFHSTLIEFTTFFGKEKASFSEGQLRSLGRLIDEAVTQGGPLGNAFATCFLEHLRQIKSEKMLRPYLSDVTRRLTRA